MTGSSTHLGFAINRDVHVKIRQIARLDHWLIRPMVLKGSQFVSDGRKVGFNEAVTEEYARV